MNQIQVRPLASLAVCLDVILNDKISNSSKNRSLQFWTSIHALDLSLTQSVFSFGVEKVDAYQFEKQSTRQLFKLQRFMTQIQVRPPKSLAVCPIRCYPE
ncbi:hypothetical protein QE152_g32278 [Popillia japonica]|uniref:Uncharacterized protein n=1 Tax=Popillia japonica TaxID=7064 RepID=A0AAW1IZF8_POPJA